MDYKTDYWAEILSNLMEENGLDIPPTDVLSSIADGLKQGHEMFDESHGVYNIPHPALAEMEQLKKKHKAEIRDAEKSIDNLKAAYASAARIPKEAVYVDIHGGVGINQKRVY